MLYGEHQSISQWKETGKHHDPNCVVLSLRDYSVESVGCSVLSDSLWPLDRSPPGSSVHGDPPGKKTGVGCHDLLQGIFPTQGSNPGLPHCRQILYRLIKGHGEKVWKQKSELCATWQTTTQAFATAKDVLTGFCVKYPPSWGLPR